MKKGTLETIKSKSGKLCLCSAEHSFLCILILFFVALLVGGCLFYQYGILAQKAEPQITGQTIQLEENLYQDILEQWQARKDILEAADTKTFPDLFR